MPVTFRVASRENKFLRMALAGPSGSGKTLTALKIARWLGERVVVIDTERRSAELYAGHADVPDPFYVYDLERFAPRHYCQCIDAVLSDDLKFDVCIVDSITPSWDGKEGVLEIAGGDIRGWKAANPEYNKLVDKITGLNDRIHMIVTFRSKMQYNLELDDVTKRMTVVNHGMHPIHKDQMPYEFDVFGVMDQNNVISFGGVGKQRVGALRGKTFADPGKDVAIVINQWLKGGSDGETG